MTDPDPRCTTHPSDIAGWRCVGDCKQPLCGKCTATLLKVFVCCGCGGAARRITIPRKSKSFTHWLGRAVFYPLLGGGLMFALLAAVFGTIAFLSATNDKTHELTGVFTGVRAGAVSLYAVVLVDATARGGLDSGAAGRIARAIAATGIVWLPAAAYVFLIGVPGKGASHDLVLWMFAVLSFMYLPLALAIAVIDLPLGAALDPFRVFEHMFQLGWTYVRTLVVIAFLAGIAGAAAFTATASLKASISSPVAGELVAALPWLWAIGALAATIGTLMYVHGDAIGWGTAAEFADPRYPKMVAEGRRKLAQPASGQGPEEAPVDAAERADATKLAEALRSENHGRALRIYEARTTWSPASVDDRKLIQLARTAARAKKLELAERMLDDAYQRGGRSAPHALLALAQLNGESLGRTERATELYRKLVEEFPTADVAKIAAKKLAP